MTDRLYHILVAAFGILIAALLVGARLDLTFAGGEGYAPPLLVNTIESSGTVSETRGDRTHSLSSNPPRGATIATDRGARALLEIDGTFLGLYEDSVIGLKSLADERLELELFKGRIAIDSLRRPDRKVIVLAGPIQATSIAGQMSVVNYDFQLRVSVIPLIGFVSTVIANQQGEITGSPLDIQMDPPYTVTETTFTIDGSVAEDFYQWFFEVVGV